MIIWCIELNVMWAEPFFIFFTSCNHIYLLTCIHSTCFYHLFMPFSNFTWNGHKTMELYDDNYLPCCFLFLLWEYPTLFFSQIRTRHSRMSDTEAGTIVPESFNIPGGLIGLREATHVAIVDHMESLPTLSSYLLSSKKTSLLVDCEGMKKFLGCPSASGICSQLLEETTPITVCLFFPSNFCLNIHLFRACIC